MNGIVALYFGGASRPDPIQRRFGAREFLEAGKEEGDWFEVSSEARRIAEESGPDAVAQLGQIEEIMAEVNAFLARSDVGDAEKLEFLRRFMGRTDVDWEDGDDEKEDVAAHFGPIFARLSGTDTEAIEEVLDLDTLKYGERFDTEELTATLAAFEEEFSKWKKDNDIKQEPDQALARFAKLSQEAEERRKKRATMSHDGMIEDIRSAKAQLLEDVSERKAQLAERS
ncbi:MAG: hypothetical protein IT384_18675 [Deltaproteobacteria bacterium]|nr:hypothetical protein [Deltaproteobacteria bacterium]